MNELSNLEGLLERATPLPWRVASQRLTGEPERADEAEAKNNAIWAGPDNQFLVVAGLCLLRPAKDGEPWVPMAAISADDATLIVEAVNALPSLIARLKAAEEALAFQARVDRWLLACFGETIARDCTERNHRFLEESLELAQACGCTASEAHQLVDYTFDRPTGEKGQEVGGVMNTLAALCLAHGIDMLAAGSAEMDRVEHPETMAKIRAKQAAKPKHSPLPEARALKESGS